ncbi:MAG: hypothetical protein COA38_17055 [Fluviicola sp.]|nr:MAG: hypothetical protein COA38_17055 [Fluviicola sp.]
MKDHIKIIVIGGGPAGAVMAIELARDNMEVIVLEASSIPRQKPGECLPPNITPLLQKLKLEHLLEKHKLSYGNEAVWGSEQIREENFIFGIHGEGTHIDRVEFEKDLALEAKKEGVVWLYDHSVKKSVRADHQWNLEVDHQNTKKVFTADFVVDASGRKAVFGRHVGVKRIPTDKLVGISAIYSGRQNLNASTLIESTPHGWWYSASLPDNKLVVTFMTDSDLISPLNANQVKGWITLLENTTHTIKRVKGDRSLEIDSSTLKLDVNSACSSRLETITGSGWLAIGDAACTFDPLSSYGITAAMGTAYYGSCSIKDHFKGKKESFLAYNYLMDKMYHTYSPLVVEAYCQENRWKNETFWKRRTDR